MAFKRIENGKYLFQIIWEKKRHQKIAECPRSHVQELYRIWEKEVFDSLIGKNKLADKMAEYLGWSKNHKRPRMFAIEEDHSRVILEYFGNPFLHEIKRHKILEFAAWRKTRSMDRRRKVVSDACVKGTVQTLSFFMGWCKEREYVKDNPAYKLRLRGGVPRLAILSPDQIRALLAVARGHQVTFILIAITTGLRHSEILNLKWKEVHLDKKMITLPGEKTKSHRNRQVVFPEVLYQHLRKLSEERIREWKSIFADEDQAMLFGRFLESNVVLYNGAPIKSFKISWAFVRKRAGMRDLRIHDLRHAYATTLRSSGMPLAEIKELLGHTDLATTQRYAHFDGEIRGSLEVFDKILYSKLTGDQTHKIANSESLISGLP